LRSSAGFLGAPRLEQKGEIVIVRAGVVYVLNHDGTLIDVGGAAANIVQNGISSSLPPP
jgi:hypothetical protein